MTKPVSESTAPRAPALPEWPDDDTAREYVDLAELEDLDALPPASGGEGAPALAVPDAPRIAEAETTADRVARRLEGMDVEESDALGHRGDEADSQAFPDDEIAREAEALVP